MIHLYDEAFINKLKQWTKNTSVDVYTVEETERLFQVTADKTFDKSIKLPLIALTRSSGFQIINSNKKPLSYDGFKLEANSEYAQMLSAIPVTIPYKLDVYTRYQKENDLYIRNLIFNIINYPTLYVDVTYNGKKFTHMANIRFSSNTISNSASSLRLFSDQFCRQTLSLEIDDAYLWDVRMRGVVCIDDSMLQYKSEHAEDELPDAGFITEYLKLGE